MKKPWVGTSPWRLALRGGVQLALSGLVIWGCLQVIGEHIEITDTALADYEANVERAAWGVMAVAGLFALYSVIRLAVGIADLVSPRELVDGVVVSTANRRTGDFLPRIAQELIYRRSHNAHQYEMQRKRWSEMVLETSDGQRTLVVSSGVANTYQPGARVTARVSRILKHVGKVERVGTGQAVSLSNPGQ